MHTFQVSKQFSFEAAHSLPHLPRGHKCRNLHGHSYRFEVVCRGVLDHRGFVVDYAEISQVVKPIIGRLDHQNLNELFDFPTTAEYIAQWLYREIKKGLPVYQILLFETAKTRVNYPVY